MCYNVDKRWKYFKWKQLVKKDNIAYAMFVSSWTFVCWNPDAQYG